VSAGFGGSGTAYRADQEQLIHVLVSEGAKIECAII
jgi:hypothetical protein